MRYSEIDDTVQKFDPIQLKLMHVLDILNTRVKGQANFRIAFLKQLDGSAKMMK